MADAEKAQQVLLNLLSNAIKFTEPGGEVRLECACTEDVAAVRVVDTGLGIPPEKQEAIFQPFVQVDQQFTRQGHGTGLGLSISRELARAMGGDIVVESVVGEGTVFTLRLPRVVEAGHTASHRAEIHRAGGPVADWACIRSRSIDALRAAVQRSNGPSTAVH